MKKIEKLLLLSLLPLLFIKCEKTDDGSYVAPLTVYEKMAGKWYLASIMLVDEIAKANSVTPDEEELKSEFNFNTFNITFNVDADSLPTTFEVGGDAPELFITGGYWELDSPFPHTDGTPVKIYLYTDNARTQLADKLSITSIPGTKKELEFKLTRMSVGAPYASYIYKLVQH
jgi:hypothetical protein